MIMRRPADTPRRLLLALGLAGLLAAGPAWSIDLLESWRQALAKNPAWLAARAQAEAERQELPLARSQLLPNLSWSMSRFKNDLESRNKNILGQTVTSESEYFSHNKTLTLRQPLFRPQLYYGYRQAEYVVEAAEARLDQSAQELAVKVGGAYFETLLAQDQLDLVRAQVAATEGLRKSAQAGFEKGTGTRTDIDEAQSRLDLSLAEQVVAEQALLVARHQLEALIDGPVESLARLDPARLPLQTAEAVRLEDWIAKAEAVNPELRSLAASIAAAERDLSKQRAGHLPTVDLVAQKTDAQSDNPTSASSGYDNTMVGVQVSIPLFAGGHTSASTDRARAALNRFRHEYESRRLDVGVRVRREFQAVAEGQFKVRAYEQAERSARQLIVSTEKGILAGTRTQIDLLNAEQQLMLARRDLARARYDFIMARLRLHALAGSVDEDLLLSINGALGTAGG